VAEPDQNFASARHEVLALIGATLLMVQMAEKMIEVSSTYILQLDGPITMELLRRIENRKITIGQMLVKMRKKIQIHETFDERLSEFLECRNLLVHRIDEVHGWSLNDESGLAYARQFLARVFDLSRIVLRIFGGLARAWSLENPTMDLPMFPAVLESETAEPFANFIFSAKSSEQH
jgi:hypothetical protein